jgi:hypothetical protein
MTPQRSIDRVLRRLRRCTQLLVELLRDLADNRQEAERGPAWNFSTDRGVLHDPPLTARSQIALATPGPEVPPPDD